MIRKVTHTDADQIARIYNHYIENTVITFEEDPISANEMIKRIEKVTASGFSWYVAVEGDEIIGYAYASKWNERSAYRHTAEVSIYLAPEQRSKGLGTRLYTVLFDELKTQSMNAIIGGVAIPNEASVALHEKFGMRKVAHFEKVGYKRGQWLDVGYWQILLQT